MKITFISPFYPPSRGGVEAIVKQTAEALVRRNNTVSVITTNYNNSWVKLSNQSVDTENGVRIYRIEPHKFKIGYAALPKGLPKIIRQEGPDIVHSHNLHPHLFQAMSLKHSVNFKLISQLHYPLATGIDGVGSKLVFPLIMKSLRFKQAEIDAFVVHTILEKKWLVNAGLCETKVHQLAYPSVDTDRPTNKISLLLAPDLLYIGRVTYRKGLHILLKAIPEVIQYFPDLKVIIAGPRDQKYFNELVKITNQVDLVTHVTFLPELSEEEKNVLISNCKLFVAPSIKDYTPVNLIEAQSLGKPVISTTTGAIPDLVKNNDTGLLVEPLDSNALAMAIIRLLSNEKERLAMGNKAKDWVIKNFSLNDVIVGLENLYYDCMRK